ncbi:MAG: carbohydrate porin [Myxococcota bacterium]
MSPLAAQDSLPIEPERAEEPPEDVSVDTPVPSSDTEMAPSEANAAEPAAPTEPAAQAGAEPTPPPPAESAPTSPQLQPTQLQPQPADEEASEAEAEEPHVRSNRFYFGSYGRISAASNLDGGLGQNSNIVGFGPRIDEDVYAELELRREDILAPGVRSKVVATLALSGPLFHLDGEFDENLAVRNLFAEIDGALLPGLSIWAGSRMVRGDDVYLLNFWPLDNLNIVGGGVGYRYQRLMSFRLHVGMNRPRDPFFLQTRDVVARRGFEPARVSLLDRPRVVTALRSTIYPIQRPDFGVKVVLYGELHRLPSGERTLENGDVESLPSDGGYLLGAQVGLWHNREGRPGPTGAHTERSFINLFARYARGLAAYDTFDAPFRNGRVIQSDSASELLFAASASFEYAWFGVQVGAYYRRFRDADVNGFAGGAYNEGTINLRPQFFFGDFAGVSVDLSYQALALAALDETNGQPLRGGITKLGLIPFISLGGRGTFARPRLRLIYSLSLRDEDAQRLYPLEDPRSQSSVEHFLGIGAEWWFDSTSYNL